MDAYTYRPLEGDRHIRLLQLRKTRATASESAASDGVVASLEHVDLDDPDRPRYEPLSYV